MHCRECVLDRQMPPELTLKIGQAIKKRSSSFIPGECTPEIRVCASLALGQAIEQGGKSEEWAAGDVLALSVWLAADFIPPLADPKLEALRIDFLTVGRRRVSQTAIVSRARKPVPDAALVGAGAITQEELAKVLTPLDALRFNAALDREELDLLWWLYAARSEIVDKPLASLPDATRAIVTGVELGRMMRRLPSQSHRNIALRDVAPGIELTLVELVAALGDHCQAIATTIEGETLVQGAPDVFPLLSAIKTGTISGPGSRQSRALGDWALRAILERSAINVQYKANRKI